MSRSPEIGWVFVLGMITAVRVLVLIALASLIWVPIGVAIGLRPRLADRVQPIVQFLAAFPANLFFPPVVLIIVYFHLNPEIWLSPLMILGTQWYILFNVIGGAAALPAELQRAAQNLGVQRWLWWRRVMLPAIFPGLCDRSRYCCRRVMERQHRRRSRAMGEYGADRDWDRRLHRPHDRRRRQRADRARDQRAVHLRSRIQPPAVAAAV